MSRAVSSVDAGQTFLELHHQLHRIVDRAMSSAGLSLGRAKVLMRLDSHGPMNQARLAGLLGFAPRSVTETVDGLERDGLVTRAGDPHDRRARIVALTASGRDALQAAMTVRNKTMDDIFGVLSAAERAQLVSLLNTVRTNLAQGEIDCGH
ncbi:MAG TPA: MarR family winged helix-turn-helix transcriptional regulator [Mycobacterium sp.]|jgi:DNA-binding MarR family transcriptional regulator|nr:MarR family winged helix-turn-helix transcriptional regulator [Mycobacterium sp.]